MISLGFDSLRFDSLGFDRFRRAEALTGVLFGLAPAIQSTRVDLMPALKVVRARGSRAHGGRRLSPSRVLVVAQIALTLLILVAAGLFLRTLSNLESIHLGFNREQLLTFQLNARQAGQHPRCLIRPHRLRRPPAVRPLPEPLRYCSARGCL